MKRNYYCLVAGLQDIAINTQKLVINQLDFRNSLMTELHPDDYKLVELLFLPIDNNNLLNLLENTGKPHNLLGKFTREELEENIKEPASLPRYMVRFIEAYKAKNPIYPNLLPENELITLFINEMQELKNDFIKGWYQFESNIRNILTALNSRKFGFEYEKQIIGSDDIAMSIGRSQARDFGLTGVFDQLDNLMSISKMEDVQERELAIDTLRWNYLDGVTFFEYFTVERVLAFTIKLGIVERWLSVSREHGEMLFNKLFDELKQSYQLPESFAG